MIKHKKKERGALLILIIIFSLITTTMIGGVLSLIVYQKKLSKRKNAKEQSLYIAEAGINYYRWHLSHIEDDYADNCNNINNSWCAGATIINCTEIDPCGPFVHEYKDHLGGTIGTFTLNITPPQFGSTVVGIQSIGATNNFSNQKRTIKVLYGKKSKTKYAIISNAYIWEVGTVYGPIHSNTGVHFEGGGTAWGLVTSREDAFIHNAQKDGIWAYRPGFGVHASYEPDAPSLNPPTESLLLSSNSTFRAGRSYPTIDPIAFSMGDDEITDIISVAEDDSSCGIGGTCVIPPSGEKGWHVQLQGNKFQYRKIITLESNCNGNETGNIVAADDWITDVPWPTEGVIQVKDNTWIDGNIQNNRLTLIAAENPPLGGSASIWINDNINYVQKDGSEVMALIAQDFIRPTLDSPDNLKIDSTLFAVSKSVMVEPYKNNCSLYYKNSITINGSIMSNELYRLRWTILPEDYESGYENTNINFDSNTIINPPPHFPIEDKATFILWEEE